MRCKLHTSRKPDHFTDRSQDSIDNEPLLHTPHFRISLHLSKRISLALRNYKYTEENYPQGKIRGGKKPYQNIDARHAKHSGECGMYPNKLLPVAYNAIGPAQAPVIDSSGTVSAQISGDHFRMCPATHNRWTHHAGHRFPAAF